MITNRIVSAFNLMRKAAVLFDMNLRNNWSKCLLVSSALCTSTMANAALELNNWWGADNAVIKSANDCNSVYSIRFSSENAGIFQLLKDGVGLNPSNLALTSDVAAKFSFEVGSDGVAYGLRHSGSAETVQLYFYTGTDKDTLSLEIPTYGNIGISADSYQNMDLTSEPTFSAKYCAGSSSEAPSTATWQWQLLDKATGSWSDIADATSTDYAPGAAVLADSAKIRVVMIDGSDSLKADPLMVTYEPAKVGYTVNGTDIFATVQQPTYENEIDFGSSFSVTVRSSGAANITSYKVYVRSDNEDDLKELTTFAAPDSVFTVTPSQNLKYRVVAEGIDMRPGRVGDPVSIIDSFFVRVRYKWDEGALIDTLFYDNFGFFNSDNEYETCDGKVFTDSLVANDSSKNVIVNYWAADYYNSIKNHKFAILNPLAGPFSGDCSADGWSHYACWDDGACNGYRVEDGYYAILPNPDYSNCGRAVKDYWNGYDHTYESTQKVGGMMFVNCAAGSDHTVLLERQITLDNECENTRLLFTSYVNNATSVSTNKPVNVRLIVRDEDSTVIYETPSGNIYPRSIKGGQWANLSFMFSAAKGGKYTLQLVNNQQGGADAAGNDLLFDDICISAAYPVVNVYRNRAKTNATPVDTCEEVDVPLFVLNKDDIKKYITNPIYLYQYSKDTTNWVNIGTFTSLDSFVVSLRKADPTFWDTTYFRGIAASNQNTITRYLAGDSIEMTCDNIYAVSNPFRVVFDYSGPLDATVYDTLCVGETFSVTVSTHKRPAYRWVDSYSKETINNMDSTFSYVVKATDPADTLFYFVTEQRLGCTDTMEVYVHRRLFVDFKTPENFVVCLYDSTAHLTDVFPSTGAKFTWKSGDYSATTDVNELAIPETLPLQGTFSVLGEADDYCATTKSFPYDIHKPITVTLATDRTDSLFCLGSATTEYSLTANTVTGVPTMYYWIYDNTQVAFTKAPVNTYSFGALSEGKHEFGVKVVDEVCNVTGKSEFTISNPTEVREPITIAMTADTAICEGSDLTAEVTLQHLLNAEGTSVNWSVASANGSFATATTSTTADMKSTNVVTPIPTTTTIEPMVLNATVTDMVCTDNKPEASATVNVYKKLDVTVTTDRNDSLFCMDGTTGITFTATTNRGYVNTYNWFADSVFVASTGHDENTYTFPVVSEGKHYYGVRMADGVCNPLLGGELAFEVPIEVREPITIAMTADTAVCEGANANAEVALQHLLKAEGTAVVWEVTSSNGTLANTSTTTTADMKSTNVVTPVPTTSTTEAMVISAGVTDKVCTDNKPVATATVNVYKKLDVTVTTDRTDSLFCMNGSTGITFTATTNRGHVNTYNWYADSVLAATTGYGENTYTFPVTTEGKHYYAVRMADGVCNPIGGGEISFEVPIETRMPITMKLAADPTFCEDGTLSVNATFDHLLADPTQVSWTISDNGKLQSSSTQTSASASSNVISPNSASNSKEIVTVSASVTDKVCPENNPVSASVTSELHKLVKISLAADGLSGVKCLATDADVENGLTITVEKGNPVFYTWSDGDTTTATTRQYKLALGDNVITAYAYDSVCAGSSAAAEANVSVTTRQPLLLNLVQTVGTNPICYGSQVAISANVENNYPGDEVIYQWSPATLGSDKTVSYTAVVGENIVYSTVIASNAICPAQSASMNVIGQDSVRISVTAPSSFCQLQDTSEALTLIVNVISGKPSMFVWSTGDTTISNALDVYPTASSKYSVYAVDNVCANSFAVSSGVVSVSNMFTLHIDAVEDEVQMGTNAQFTSVVPEGIAAGTLTWFTNGDSTGTAPLGSYSQMIPLQGSYTFYAVADGGYCGKIRSNEVDIAVADYYQVPTAFTPYNSNPKNNIFMKGYQVEIFNRYQQLVYEGNDGWDGRYNGSLADPGTYFYRLTKKDGRTLKGTIELVKF